MWCSGMGQGLFYASAAVVRKSAVSAACMYNAVQQISGLVIILTIYYLATSITIVLRILVLNEDSVVLFAVQIWGKSISYSKTLALKQGKMGED